jgi:translation initiation factor 1 (eIF-1/SUI1)
MFPRYFHLNSKMSLRDKARLNVCIAKDLAENFGGTKAFYLKMLNKKLKMKIACGSALYDSALAKAA